MRLSVPGGGRVVRCCWVNFQCRGVLLIWIRVGQGPTALAAGAGGNCLDIFSLVYHFSFLSPSLWETARYRLKYCLKGPLSPKQPTNQLSVLYHSADYIFSGLFGIIELSLSFYENRFLLQPVLGEESWGLCVCVCVKGGVRCYKTIIVCLQQGRVTIFSLSPFSLCWWSGGAMVLGKLPVPGRPTIWITVGQGLLRLQ